MKLSKQTQIAFISGIIAMSNLGFAQAATTTQNQSQEIVNPAFSRMDTNRDGYVSAQEAKQHGILDDAFKDADANHDGKLSRDEFVKAASIDERKKVAKFMDDSWITTKVKAELLKDSLVKGTRVSVETYKGTVQLSGFVDNSQQASKAEQIAGSVEGVQKVVNDLIVKN